MSHDCTIHIAVTELPIGPEVSLRSLSQTRYFNSQLNSNYFCILCRVITKMLMLVYACD